MERWGGDICTGSGCAQQRASRQEIGRISAPMTVAAVTNGVRCRQQQQLENNSGSCHSLHVCAANSNLRHSILLSLSDCCYLAQSEGTQVPKFIHRELRPNLENGPKLDCSAAGIASGSRIWGLNVLMP